MLAQCVFTAAILAVAFAPQPTPTPISTPVPTPSPTTAPETGPGNNNTAPLLLTAFALSPTSVLLIWEFNERLAIDERNNIRSIRIEVSTRYDRTGEITQLQLFEIILPLRPIGYEFVFLRCGINATFTISVNDTFTSVDINGGSEITQQNYTTKITLPGCHSICNARTGQVDDACPSYCICYSPAFSGPTCEDPQFHPRNISVWPTSNRSLHIEWSFEDDVYEDALEDLDMRLQHFQIEVLQVSDTLSLQSRVTVPITSRSYEVRQIETGVEHYVTISTVADALPFFNDPPLTLVANASSARVLIDENLFTVDPPSCPTPSDPTSPGPCSSPQEGDSPPIGAIVGPVLGTALVVGLVSVIVTVVCMRKMTQASTLSRDKMIVRNPVATPTSNASVHSRDTTRMQPNPAYGQLDFETTLVNLDDTNTDDTSSGTGTGTFTYDYINLEL